MLAEAGRQRRGVGGGDDNNNKTKMGRGRRRVSEAEVAAVRWRWQQGGGGGGSMVVATAALWGLCGNGDGRAAAGRAKPPWPLAAADSTSGQAPSANTNTLKQAPIEIMLKQPETYLTFNNRMDF